jgi:hypothetical protein
MIKKTFIAFMMVNEVVDESTGEMWPVLKPHDHPVFKGDVAYDLGEEQEISIDEKLNVREFASEGEAITAVQDYYREVANEISRGEKVEVVQVEKFYLMQQITMSDTRIVNRSKKVSNKKVK